MLRCSHGILVYRAQRVDGIFNVGPMSLASFASPGLMITAHSDSDLH